MTLGRKVDDPHMRYVVCQARASGRCEYCGEETVTKAFYHKDEKRHPGADGMIALCRECFEAIRAQQPLPKQKRKREKPAPLFGHEWLEPQIDKNKYR